MGGSPELTCKMDIFALGVLFHQYFTGVLPGYDTSLGNYTGEAVANGSAIMVSTEIPDDVHSLLVKMLDADPHNRPTALEVYAVFAGKTLEEVEQSETKVDVKPSEKPVVTETEKTGGPKIADSTVSGNPFFRPGDL